MLEIQIELQDRLYRLINTVSGEVIGEIMLNASEVSVLNGAYAMNDSPLRYREKSKPDYEKVCEELRR